MSQLGRRLLDIHDALRLARLPHAFGGAIALAYCTLDPRGTHDLDLNVFVAPDRAGDVFAAMPDQVEAQPGDLERAERDGEVRLRWEDTPVDLFLDTLDFHRRMPREVRRVPFQGRTIPVVGCSALIAFKAMLDRDKHWADIEAIVEGGNVDVAGAAAALEEMVGPHSPRVQRLVSLTR